MALWRDPLDELIADLERTLPPDARGTLRIPRIEDVQAYAYAILYRTGEDRARALKEPGVQRFLQYYEELAKLPGSTSEPRRQQTTRGGTPTD
jgi:hypothetical protein